MLFIYLSEMLSSSLWKMLKLSKTTSPNKLFDYDCVTLYQLIIFTNTKRQREKKAYRRKKDTGKHRRATEKGTKSETEK